MKIAREQHCKTARTGTCSRLVPSRNLTCKRSHVELITQSFEITDTFAPAARRLCPLAVTCSLPPLELLRRIQGKPQVWAEAAVLAVAATKALDTLVRWYVAAVKLQSGLCTRYNANVVTVTSYCIACVLLHHRNSGQLQLRLLHLPRNSSFNRNTASDMI